MRKTHSTKVTFDTLKNDIKKSDSAIREAIANSIDANSKNIYLNLYTEKTINGIEIEYFCLDIADDGEGIPVEEQEFEKAFCQYKVSQKKGKLNYGRN
jgi:DNA topoisomerase VI subunit B